MHVAEVHRLVDTIVAVDQTADASMIEAGLGDVARLLAWGQAQQMRLAGYARSGTPCPEQAIAGSRIGIPAATKLLDRATTSNLTPVLADAAADGQVSGEHIDAVTRTLKSVQPELRNALAAKADTLTPLAISSTPEQYARQLNIEARQLEQAAGIDRLKHQQRSARFKAWTDRTTGMWRFTGQLDPYTGLKISNRLDATIAALFAEATPDTCPTDPTDKQDHLRALAFAALINGQGANNGQGTNGTSQSSGMSRPAPMGRPEIIVVIDTRETDPVTGGPAVDWGDPNINLPWTVLLDLAEQADIHTIIIDNGQIIRAPGKLHLGRTNRLANRDQRRVLRALYPTCTITDCTVPYKHCKIHHIIQWEHHGPTDIEILIPLCNHHHTQLHQQHWKLHLHPNRTLTITYPNGTQTTTTPPTRKPGPPP